MAAIPRAYAAPEETGGLEEVVVTATKRAENLQDVPVSITALGTEKLQELGITNFNDYVKFLPSVAYQSLGPGFARVFMRGVASGDNGNHSGPLPSVGVYLDEQPITTIQGALDIHVYDIERSEEHTSELQSPCNLVCRLLLEKKKKKKREDLHYNE